MRVRVRVRVTVRVRVRVRVRVTLAASQCLFGMPPSAGADAAAASPLVEPLLEPPPSFFAAFHRLVPASD